MADGLLRAKVKKNNLNVVVDSAGTGDWHVGKAPDQRMRETAKKNKYSIDNLRARQFSVEDFDEFDHIYVMDKSNYNNVIKLARNEEDKQKVMLILNLLHPGRDLEVPDPYYGGDQGFQEVFEMLDEATNRILEEIK